MSNLRSSTAAAGNNVAAIREEIRKQIAECKNEIYDSLRKEIQRELHHIVQVEIAKLKQNIGAAAQSQSAQQVLDLTAPDNMQLIQKIAHGAIVEVGKKIQKQVQEVADHVANVVEPKLNATITWVKMNTEDGMSVINNYRMAVERQANPHLQPGGGNQKLITGGNVKKDRRIITEHVRTFWPVDDDDDEDQEMKDYMVEMMNNRRKEGFF